MFQLFFLISSCVFYNSHTGLEQYKGEKMKIILSVNYPFFLVTVDLMDYYFAQ